MTAAIQLMEWLESLPQGADVGVDEGGLCLRAVVDSEVTDAYFELGGIPEEIESSWESRPGHPESDWMLEVANDTTRLGYVAWCDNRDEQDARDGKVRCTVCGGQCDASGSCDSAFCSELAASETCTTCSRPYAPFGDGWDGECPDCADKRFIIIDEPTAQRSEEQQRQIVEYGKTLAHGGGETLPGRFEAGEPKVPVYYFHIRVGIGCNEGAAKAKDILENSSVVFDYDEDDGLAQVVDYEVTGGDV
jgi:DNA-directed RNA polymerase subunit RPC12/RpoP